ncbi:MAG: archaemetzincin family Zn-dependent metalloprotease [Candidatus Hodarchaeota archaeon]
MIRLVRIGNPQDKVVEKVGLSLNEVFQPLKCEVLESILPVPMETYNPQRLQFHSTPILRYLSRYVNRREDMVLGITNIDLYVPSLNFIFGLASHITRTSIISLCRLMPEFYYQPPNPTLLERRAIKEAVHELGHVLGAKHCSNSKCVMHFSNDITMTDEKEHEFCSRCRKIIDQAISSMAGSYSNSTKDI